MLLGLADQRIVRLDDGRVLIFGGALVALMVFRPEGILPSRRRRAEMEEGQAGMGTLGAADVTAEASP